MDSVEVVFPHAGVAYSALVVEDPEVSVGRSGVETTAGGLTIDGSYSCGAAGSFIGTFNYQEGSTAAFAAS